MQINGIGGYYPSNINNNYTPQFGAQFSRKDLKILINSAKNSTLGDVHPAEALPRLYTMLEYMLEIPGKVVRLKYSKIGEHKNIKMNYKEVMEADDSEKILTEVILSSPDYRPGHVIGSAKSDYGFNDRAFAALKDSTVKSPEDKWWHYLQLKMPEGIFEMEWWKNRHIKEEDIMKLAYDA